MDKKKLAILMLLISIFGFIYSQNIKSGYRIFRERVTTKQEFAREFYVTAGNNYQFSVWATDELRGAHKWTSVEANVKLVGPGNNILCEKQIVATGSGDDTGNQRATNGYDIRHVAVKSENLSLACRLVDGDYMDIEVYENLPENAYWLPVLFIAIFLAGGVLFLKSRNTAKGL